MNVVKEPRFGAAATSWIDSEGREAEYPPPRPHTGRREPSGGRRRWRRLKY